MPLTDGTSHNLPDESNPSSITPSDSIHVNIYKKLMVEYEFCSRKDGYKKMSEALRAGIKSCIDGSLELKTDMDENPKIKEVFTPLDIGLKDLKNDTYNIKISLGESLLHKFDNFILQKGLSRNRAIREIVYAQILKWKKKYDNTATAEAANNTIAVNPEDIKRLRQELELLKQKYGFGLELGVVWIPKLKSDKEAEVIGNKICLYSLTFEEAKFWLKHEYHEYCQHVTSSKPLVEAMNLTLIFWKMVMDYFNNEGYKKREKYIEKLIENLK